MSQQVIIDRDLWFRGAAAYNPNVKGPMMTELKMFDECFFTDADEHDWGEEADNGCTIDHASVDGGATTLVTGAVNDDCGELYHSFQWSAASNCGAQFKVKVSRSTDLCVCCGFVDAKEDLDDHVAIEMSGTTLYAATKTTDYAGMVFDTDADSDVWYCASQELGTEGTPVAAEGSLAPVADTYFYVRLQTNTDGDVTFYYGTSISRLVPIGFLHDAIAAASTDLLSPYVACISRTTSALTTTVSRVTVWQDN